MKKPFLMVVKIMAVLILVAIFFASRFFANNQNELIASEYTSEEIRLGLNLIEGEIETKDSIDLLRVGDPPPVEKSFLNQMPALHEGENVYVAMIDNHRYARGYHKGLSKARIIIEAPAEGGIPRLVSIFSESDDLKEIGPIRSTRDYFLDILKPFNPLIAHAGGSPMALNELAVNNSFLDLDNEWGDDSFWREDEIMKPHNLFISTENIKNYFEKNSWEKPLTENVFEYTIVFPAEEQVESFEVLFGAGVNNVTWEWDKKEKAFLRKQDNEVEEIYAKNIIIIISDHWLLGDDDKARIGVKTTGEDIAYIFRDGRYLKCKWSRKDNDFFRFTDEKGNSIGLEPGKIFFELIESENNLKINKAD